MGAHQVGKALTALKYFNEDAPQYQIICASSLVDVAFHQDTSFPVGKVEFLALYPLSFFEFMMAMGKGQYVELLQKGDFEMATTFRQDYVDLLKHYYYVGGMPEVVQSFTDGNELFKELKGALTEQYVLQQLKTLKNVNTYYWAADRGTAEVDFVVDNGSDAIPIEVKAEANLQAKSLKVYQEKFAPKMCIRMAMVDYKKQDWLVNLPLWAVGDVQQTSQTRE